MTEEVVTTLLNTKRYKENYISCPKVDHQSINKTLSTETIKKIPNSIRSNTKTYTLNNPNY